MNEGEMFRENRSQKNIKMNYVKLSREGRFQPSDKNANDNDIRNHSVFINSSFTL